MPRQSGREGPSPKEGQSSVPSSFPETPPPPSYSPPPEFGFLDIIMAMQGTLGKLTEAVDGLKHQSQDHGSELKVIAKDVHAAKVVIAVVGAIILAVAGLVAWTVNTYISTRAPK